MELNHKGDEREEWLFDRSSDYLQHDYFFFKFKTTILQTVNSELLHLRLSMVNSQTTDTQPRRVWPSGKSSEERIII